MRKIDFKSMIFIMSTCAAVAIVLSVVLYSFGMQIDPLALSFGSLVTLISVQFYVKLARLLIMKRGTIASLMVVGTAKLLLLLSFLYWIINAERVTLLSGVAGLLIFIPAVFFLPREAD